MRPGIARLPKGVIVGMLQELSPLRRAPLEQDLVRVGQRAHAEEELVSIRGLVIERFGVLVQGIFKLLGEAIEEPEILGEEQRPVVMKVVAGTSPRWRSEEHT